MNRNQAIALAIAAVNVVFIFLFPPFDLYSIANSKTPIFGGFNFYFNFDRYMAINTSVLALELLVVLINLFIAWLLLLPKNPAAKPRRIGLQNASLIFTAINLVVVVLFPPFESVFAITRAALPSFEGFYLIFARQPHHVIVTPILYLEVIFVLVNGAIFWLIFRDKNTQALTPEEAMKLMLEMRRGGR